MKREVKKILMTVGVIIFTIIGIVVIKEKKAKEIYASYPTVAVADMMKVPELKEQVKSADICVIAEVEKGVEESELFTVPGTSLFGNTEEDFIMMEKMQADNLLPEEVSYYQFSLKVEEYIYDNTGKYTEQLDVIYGLMLQDYGIPAETGMKVVMFLSPSESFDGKYFGEIAWAYYISEDGALIPTTDIEKQKEYKGKKLDQYIKKIKRFCEATDE